MSGIGSCSLRHTPISVIDFETTGLSADRDRVVEVTVVRADPGGEPRVVFDTLINPQRKVSATDIHGITDDHVKDAPVFADVAGDLLDAIQGSVIAAYNVYFDLKFLTAELGRVGIDAVPPHFCLMYMRPLLNLGKRQQLHEACTHLGIPLSRSHTSSDDAMAGAHLLQYYFGVFDERGLSTYGELSCLANYKFLSSFTHDPLPGPEKFNLAPSRRSFSRSGNIPAVEISEEQIAIRAYWDVIKEVVADLQVTDDEAEYAAEQRKALGLSKEQIRYLHARAFAAAINQFIDDQYVDDNEVRKLRKLRHALARMGWAPGD